MAIVKVSEILKMADEANTSVIGFNCTDYNMVASVCQAAEITKIPVLVMLYPEHCFKNKTFELESFVGMFNGLAEKCSTPIALHLDHCSDINYLLRAIKAGFTSVMYDGSNLPLEQNIENTKYVVNVAKEFGVDVEAELGHVGFAANSEQEKLDLYTRPETAKEFCEKTGITSLAVAIGSAHGVYKQTPKLDLERLEQINNATDTFLVLHGGSGIPSDQLEIAFRKGINKFNVGTEFFQLYYDVVREFCQIHGDSGSIIDLPIIVQEKLTAYLVEKMQLSKF
jgi:ketose-bisphosphate aldolase